MSAIKLAASLPQPAYSARQLLDHEQSVAASQGIAMFSLMTMAGQAVFSHMLEYYSDVKQLLVLAGKGNNGGDGFIVADLALQHGLSVHLILSCEQTVLTGDALSAYLQLQQSAANNKCYRQYQLLDAECDVGQLVANSDCIIDALFGIGFRGQLPTDIADLVTQVNQTDSPVISIDLPSGLNASTGAIGNIAINASDTISFIALKQGLLTGAAINVVGKLYLADLSMNQAFLQQIASDYYIQGKQNLPPMIKRAVNSHKGDTGMVLAIGGDNGMPGAIRLAAEASLRAGAGLVSVACHQSNQTMVFAGRPELMLAPTAANELMSHAHFTKAKVLILGPGLGQSEWSKSMFNQVLLAPKQDKFIVLDADGLNLLAQLNNAEQQQLKRDNWLLTPHPLEAARLLGMNVNGIEADRFAAVKAIANKFGGICLLKGAGTLISDGTEVWINTSGNPGMASGGMGDVLAGICGASLLQFASPLAAARYACFIHGYCADVIARQSGQIGLLASDVINHLVVVANSINK